MEAASIRILQDAKGSRVTIRHDLDEYVLRKVKNVGKPYAGKPHVRFDEEGLVVPALYSTRARQGKLV
ncbi:hypothetical protein B1748_19030 [Paenibacillus sp. MY03]|nr:hypothetical protein B1748_19030 [Paenibacillus sp. MY03]